MGEGEWIQRVVRFDINTVNGFVKSWIGSSIFMDWSIEIAAAAETSHITAVRYLFDKANINSQEEDSSFLKKFIELEVFNNLWITSKGKAVLKKIKVKAH